MEIEAEFCLCSTCALLAAADDTDDTSVMDDMSAKEVDALVAARLRLPAALFSDDDTENDITAEFSRQECDCCGTTLAGSRNRFVSLT